jgi:hypothetical protein
MSECNEIVLKIYNHPDVIRLISKINPKELRDDLRQEIAVSLLEQPCVRISGMFAKGELLKYSMKVCWLMATSKSSVFYTKYKKTDLIKAVEYFKSQQELPEIPIDLATKASQILSEKTNTIYEDHEVRVFNKFVEFGSSRKVAAYYGIPVNHVCNIVNKVKSELKKCLLS